MKPIRFIARHRMALTSRRISGICLVVLTGLGHITAVGQSSSRWQPSAGTTWYWQLTGTLDLSQPVQVYDIDLFEVEETTINTLHGQSKKVVCYFSAGSWEAWRPDADDFPEAVKGNPLEGWPDERWLDIRSADVRSIMQNRLDLAMSKGCDGVEPDNVDGYTNNSGFPLTAADQLAYNQFLAVEAHARNLAIGLKNDLDQIVALVNDFDFAVNEQCFQYDECSLLQPFINQNKAVFGVEYELAVNAFCPQANSMHLSFARANYDLDGTLWEACWPMEKHSYLLWTK
ncbi:putative endo alpha-1,4 polygalactosaminidase [Candidatus Vecturithrix granuli]|uniref:Putative endo alpha-1,4 polygalactosaminidase n=1 Tax=Vecturithrix granuli TaxID=1499967 RepID=A0A081CAI3_VECG1|nr:putative endo alpha-1,4 polygalactosaminidase [Candidatus Vecturithrix granuli]